MEEIWKDIQGYDNHYQVSSLGRFKHTDCLVCKKTGNAHTYERIRENMSNAGGGYSYVGLKRDGKLQRCAMHRLVAQAFIPNPEDKPYVNHKNSIQNDNRVENLEWCTQGENIIHYYKNRFPRLVKDEKKIALRLEQAMYDKILKESTKDDLSVNQLMNKIFKQYYSKPK